MLFWIFVIAVGVVLGALALRILGIILGSEVVDGRLGSDWARLTNQADRIEKQVARIDLGSELLTRRVKSLEDQIERMRTWTDSEFRRQLNSVTPWPLQQVYSFTLTLQPHFWQSTLKVTADEVATSRSFGGPLPARVVIERWRSHRRILLYGDINSPCPTRALLLKEPVESFETVVLWQMEFVPPPQTGRLYGDERRVELYLEEDRLAFGAVGGPFGHGVRHASDADVPLVGPTAAGTFVSLPLGKHDQLRQFSTDADGLRDKHEADYQHRDDATGVMWYLHVEDLRGLHEDEVGEQYSEQ